MSASNLTFNSNLTGRRSSSALSRAAWWRITPSVLPLSSCWSTPSSGTSPTRGRSASSSKTTSTEPRRRGARRVSPNTCFSVAVTAVQLTHVGDIIQQCCSTFFSMGQKCISGYSTKCADICLFVSERGGSERTTFNFPKDIVSRLTFKWNICRFTIVFFQEVVSCL